MKNPAGNGPGYILLSFAPQPLIVKNYALGYKIQLTLLDFSAMYSA